MDRENRKLLQAIQKGEEQILIYGMGKFQQDVEYIFDELAVEAYLIDQCPIEGHCDRPVFTLDAWNPGTTKAKIVLICDFDAEEVRQELLAKGISDAHIIVADELFLLLDDELDPVLAARGRKLAVLTDCNKGSEVSKTCGLDALLVRTPEALMLECVEVGSVKLKDYYFIVATREFEHGICVLEDLGLKVNEDFMDSDILLMPRFSEMLHETVYAQPEDQPCDCDLPFFNLIIGNNFWPFPCCPAGVQGKWADRERLYYRTWTQLWNSTWFKIYRLSMLNKTYCFCDHHFCNRLQVKVGTTDRRVYFETSKKPRHLQLEIDYTCNLHCPSCRPGPRVATPERRRLLETIVRDARENHVLDDLKLTRLAGYGDVFASKYYQDLLYGDKKRQDLFLITNGNLFTEDKFDRLLPCYENIDIYISIDAACEDTYNKLRPGGNWHKLMQNLEMLARKKREGKIRFFRIQMVVQDDNYKEIPEFVRLGEKLGVSDCYMNNLRQWGHMPTDEFERKNILNSDYTVKDKVKKYMEDSYVTTRPEGFVKFDFMK